MFVLIFVTNGLLFAEYQYLHITESRKRMEDYAK